jgi:hypothetical protein
LAPDQIAENDQVEQKNEPDRNTPTDIPHGLIPCCAATKVLLLLGAAELILKGTANHGTGGAITARPDRSFNIECTWQKGVDEYRNRNALFFAYSV